MTISVLGPIECRWGTKPRQIKGECQRTLLAVLATSGGRPVSTHALVEEIWLEQPPDHEENALQAHVSRLRRKLLGSEGAAGGHDVELISCTSGYQLKLPPEAVDATQFRRMVNHVRGNPSMDPEEAAAMLRTALGMWYGPLFGGSVGGPICQAVAAHIGEVRAMAQEMLFDLELRSGRHKEVIPELSELIEAPTLNERFCEQLMIALYRSGRQTEALALYQKVRHRLGAELGLQPSPTLRNHVQAILSHDPRLRSSANHLALRA